VCDSPPAGRSRVLFQLLGGCTVGGESLQTFCVAPEAEPGQHPRFHDRTPLLPTVFRVQRTRPRTGLPGQDKPTCTFQAQEEIEAVCWGG
jgi:hypothetical protein